MEETTKRTRMTKPTSVNERIHKGWDNLPRVLWDMIVKCLTLRTQVVLSSSSRNLSECIREVPINLDFYDFDAYERYYQKDVYYSSRQQKEDFLRWAVTYQPCIRSVGRFLVHSRTLLQHHWRETLKIIDKFAVELDDKIFDIHDTITRAALLPVREYHLYTINPHLVRDFLPLWRTLPVTSLQLRVFQDSLDSTLAVLPPNLKHLDLTLDLGGRGTTHPNPDECWTHFLKLPLEYLRVSGSFDPWGPNRWISLSTFSTTLRTLDIFAFRFPETRDQSPCPLPNVSQLSLLKSEVWTDDDWWRAGEWLPNVHTLSLDIWGGDRPPRLDNWSHVTTLSLYDKWADNGDDTIRRIRSWPCTLHSLTIRSYQKYSASTLTLPVSLTFSARSSSSLSTSTSSPYISFSSISHSSPLFSLQYVPLAEDASVCLPWSTSFTLWKNVRVATFSLFDEYGARSLHNVLGTAITFLRVLTLDINSWRSDTAEAKTFSTLSTLVAETNGNTLGPTVFQGLESCVSLHTLRLQLTGLLHNRDFGDESVDQLRLHLPPHLRELSTIGITDVGTNAWQRLVESPQLASLRRWCFTRSHTLSPLSLPIQTAQLRGWQLTSLTG